MANQITLSEDVNKLSLDGCISILKDIEGIRMHSFYCLGQDAEETLQDMKECIQLNLDNGDLDEIEVLIVLSGE